MVYFQRQVEEYDTVPDDKGESSAKLFRDGHAGILSTDFDATAAKDTTFRVSYKSPGHSGVRLMGMFQKNKYGRYLSRIVRKPVFGFPTRSDTNWAVQPQKMVEGLKFGI